MAPFLRLERVVGDHFRFEREYRVGPGEKSVTKLSLKLAQNGQERCKARKQLSYGWRGDFVESSDLIFQDRRFQPLITCLR